MITLQKVKQVIGVISVSIVLLISSQSLYAMDMKRSGSFSGLNNHIATGDVMVTKTDAGYVIKLSADFVFDGAPDPKIAFGSNGNYDASTLIAPLKSNKGEQEYLVPANIDVSTFNEVYIWCEKYNVGLGVAGIN